MGNEHPLVPRGYGFKIIGKTLDKGIILTWFQTTRFPFLSCFVSCFMGF